jgi:hypothetical protein
MDNDTVEEIKRHFDVVAEGLRSEIRAGDEALRNEIRTLDEGLRTDVRAVDEGLRNENHAVEERLRNEIRDVKRHSDVVAESLRSEIRLVAEGVAGLDEKFTQEFVRVREEIGEVKSLVLVSYSDLDRRLKSSQA